MLGALTFLLLMQRLETLEIGSPPLPIAYPEHAEGFETPADGKYLSASDFPNAPAWEGLADGRVDQGLLQITVVWPKNQGLVAPKTAADEVIAHFPKGLRLGGVKIDRQPWQAPPIIGDKDVRIPVTIPWTA